MQLNRKSITHKSRETSEKHTHKPGKLTESHTYESGNAEKAHPVCEFLQKTIYINPENVKILLKTVAMNPESTIKKVSY